jgi:hypothetical protein
MSSKKRNQDEKEIQNEEEVAGTISNGAEETNSKSQSETTERNLSSDGGTEGTGNGENGGDQQQDQTEVNDGGLKEGNDESGNETADPGPKRQHQFPGKDDAGNESDENEGAEEEEEFKGKTYSEAFAEKTGNPRRHSWPEGQVIEFFETVTYLSYPPDGARKDLYTPTEDDIKATDWEDANAD